MSQHDGDEGSDGIGYGLVGKVVAPGMGEGRGYQRHGVEMGIDHFLGEHQRGRASAWASISVWPEALSTLLFPMF